MTAAASSRVSPRARRLDLRLLTALVVVLVAIPSILVFPPLGGAGTPAEMLGMALFALWVARRMSGGRGTRSRSALMLGTLAFGLSVLASYLVATTRPITPIEVSAADRGLVSTIAWLGMLLFALDGLTNLVTLDTLLRRLSLAGGCLGALGLLQFATKQPFTNYIQIPGLSASHDLESVTSRADLTRPAGTAIHPIEFGAVLTMILPIALHYALTDRDRSPVVRWFPVLTIAAAVPISISRSAVISAVVVLIMLLPTWDRRLRTRAIAFIVALMCVLYLTVPGLLGTLTSLFTGISEDSSAQSRTDSYSLAFEFIRRQPIFGRGFKTFLPSYRILDNQYLLTTIETGIVGLAAFLALLISAIALARRSRRQSTDPRVRSLAQALAASVTAAAFSFAFYDEFSFPMAASLLFIVLGTTGAMARILDTSIMRTTADHPFS
jgi:O-antigen ligase